MGYTLELGHYSSGAGNEQLKDIVDDHEFEVVMVDSLVSNFPREEFTEELFRELSGEESLTMGLDDEELADHLESGEGVQIKATTDVTFNYTPRIRSMVSISLRDLAGMTAAEAAPTLMRIVAELDLPKDKTDRNIKHLTKKLLDWAFQHPDAIFRVIG